MGLSKGAKFRGLKGVSGPWKHAAFGAEATAYFGGGFASFVS